LPAPEVNICGREVVDALVVSLMIVMIDECLDLRFKVWSPALLGFLFSGAAAFSCLVSLAGHYLLSCRRVPGEWTGTIVGYCIAATIPSKI